MTFLTVKLFEDDFGVVHYRYSMDGVLLLCGSARGTGRKLGTEGLVTCLQCMVIYDREGIGAEQWVTSYDQET